MGITSDQYLPDMYGEVTAKAKKKRKKKKSRAGSIASNGSAYSGSSGAETEMDSTSIARGELMI